MAQPQLNENNIDQVIASMTIQEKAAILVGDAWGTRSIYPPDPDSKFPSGTVYVPGAPFSTRPIPRLGIPGTGMSDGPAGVRMNISRPGSDKKYYATSFPVGTVMASTWNTELVEYMATAMGREVKEYGLDVVLGPGMDLQRNPLCGRNFEYFSEDPFLTGKIAAAVVNGIQSNGVGTSPKHFAANDSETNRFYSDSRMSQRTLREMALKAFEIVVKESNPWTIMSSYNKINGVFTQQSYDLLTTILREEWGYEGIVLTDWGYKEGTVDAVKAGNDLMEAGLEFEIERIIEAVENGSLSMDEVDRNVKNVLKYIVKTPRFKGYKYSETPDIEANAELVRKEAAEGIVLLKNDDQLLPLKNVKNAAVFGLNSYKMIAGGTGSGNVNKKYIRNLDEGLAINGITVDTAIADWYKKYIAYQDITQSINPVNQNAVLLGSAVLTEPLTPAGLTEHNLSTNDVAIITIGRNAGEGGDRKTEDGDWYLSAAERDLLQGVADAYHSAGKKVVVVLNIGGVIETASWQDIPDAILLAWTPGQEAGYIVADILTGKSYPSGKLPMTFPLRYFDLPSSHNFPYNYVGSGTMYLDLGNAKGERQPKKDVDYINYREGIWIGYRYFSTTGKTVAYPFGYGLGFTTFIYENPVVKISSDGTVTASITVRNSGNSVGKEAVQLYVTAPCGGLAKPEMELRAFAKTKELKPGESQTLTMKIDAYTLSSFNENKSQWETAAGKYTVKFGASSSDIRCTASFVVAKSQAWPVHNVMAPKEPINEISVNCR
ncbi:MAG: glycoside hydrolase family 3 N-terminal domain-containing protein [Bacteroidales bacterium]|nr:glycoside hydrolase family 3 N-terminal domain-containing protein [Bacteroidales bacterium]